MVAAGLRRWLIALLAGGAGLAVASSASASPSAKLVYVRAPGTDACPAETELRKAVAVRIGYDPFFPVAQKTVVAQVQRVPKGYRGHVQIVGDDGVLRGERDLTTAGDDCNELIGALALAVSIALDDLDEHEPAPPPRPAPPPHEEPAPPPPTPPPAPAAPPAAEPPPRDTAGPVTATPNHAELALSLGPALSLGTAPDAAVGGDLAASVRWRSFALRLDARADLPSGKALSNGGKVSTNLVLAVASACLRVGMFSACGGPGAGAVFSETTGITHPATDRASVVVAVAQAAFDVPLGSRIYLEPDLQLGASFVPRSVSVDGASVYEMSPVWGSIGIQVGGAFF